MIQSPRPSISFGPWYRRRPILCSLIAVLALLALLDRRHGNDSSAYHDRVFQVARVVDGDTLDIVASDGGSPTTRLRLWGVDTPEVAGSRDGALHYGAEASAFTSSQVLGHTVRLVLAPSHSRDRYDRLLCYVYLEPEGGMLNELLLQTGHAYADWRFDHPLRRRFLDLENGASRDSIGLWADLKPDGQPAWRRAAPAK